MIPAANGLAAAGLWSKPGACGHGMGSDRMRRVLVPAALAAVLAAGCGPSVGELQTRGIAEFQVGHVKQARTVFEQILDRHPSHAPSLFYMGQIAHHEGKYEDAIYYFQCCLDVDPGYPQVRGWLKRSQEAAGLAGKKLRYLP